MQENESLKNELLEREKTVMERINYLQAAKVWHFNAKHPFAQQITGFYEVQCFLLYNSDYHLQSPTYKLQIPHENPKLISLKQIFMFRV